MLVSPPRQWLSPAAVLSHIVSCPLKGTYTTFDISLSASRRLRFACSTDQNPSWSPPCAPPDMNVIVPDACTSAVTTDVIASMIPSYRLRDEYPYSLSGRRPVKHAASIEPSCAIDSCEKSRVSYVSGAFDFMHIRFRFEHVRDGRNEPSL